MLYAALQQKDRVTQHGTAYTDQSTCRLRQPSAPHCPQVVAAAGLAGPDTTPCLHLLLVVQYGLVGQAPLLLAHQQSPGMFSTTA